MDLHLNGTGAMMDPDECSTLSFDPDGQGELIANMAE